MIYWLAPIVYCMISGGVWSLVTPLVKEKVHYRSDQDVVRNSIAIFWPLVIPWLAGYAITNKARTNNWIEADGGRTLSKADRRRQRELDEANHKIEIARKEAEAVAIAERSVGIK